jgi:hypothetical protein
MAIRPAACVTKCRVVLTVRTVVYNPIDRDLVPAVRACQAGCRYVWLVRTGKDLVPAWQHSVGNDIAGGDEG